MLRARLILASLGLAFLAIVSLGVNAQGTKSPQGNKDDIITAEQQLARQFGEFLDSLVRLKQRMQRGTPDEQKRAKVLGEVIDECRNLAINQEFSKMIEVLKGMNGSNLQDLEGARIQSDRLASALATILNRLRDGANLDLSAERKKLQDIIKELDKVIEQEKIIGAQNNQGKTDADELANNQKKVTEATEKVSKGIDKYLDKDGKGAEAANLKGENKDGGKKDGEKGEVKNDGKQPEGPKGEAKNEGDEKSPGPKGLAKAGDKAEPKGGAKSGDKGKEGSPEAGAKNDKGGKKGQEGSAKGNDKGDKKGQEGSAKGGDDKKDGQGSAKGDDKKGGDKQGSPEAQAKAGEPKAGEPKAAGAKASKGGDKGSEAKAGGDPKSGKQGDAKAGDSKSGQGQAKAGGEAGDPKSGGGQPPQAGQKGDGSPPPPASAGNKQNDDIAKSNKQIKEAGYDQKSAEEKIANKQKADAADKITDATNKLEEARKKLEKLLQQLREEELERVLAALQARCEKMLVMQQQVLAGTEDVHKVIQKHSDKKADSNDKREALKLSDKEKEIVLEANKCIDILEAEGSAVAFPEVFQQVRQDMIHVQKRLEISDVAEITQGIETDIIITLKEMIEALKKARQDNQDSQSKPGEPGKAGKPGDQKLLELIQELKMVRSLQKRVNDRTTTYGKRFPGQEQAGDPQIVRELRSLADRQMRIQDIVSRISKGDNK